MSQQQALVELRVAEDEKDLTMVTLSQVIKCELVFYSALSSAHISLSC